MSMTKHTLSEQCTPLEAFCIVLLASCESAKETLIKHTANNTQRMYWLERLDKAIEGVNKTFNGYLPENFQEAAREFYQRQESAISELLKSYQEG